MLKAMIFCSVAVALASALQIQEYTDHEHLESPYDEEERHHHHEVEHKHATSHQSVKFHHYHPVAVYIKKEDQPLLKHPIDIGGTKQKLKILHPETNYNHNYGLVLESHVESSVHEHGQFEEPLHHHREHYEHYHHE